MNDTPTAGDADLSARRRMEPVCDLFEAAWRAGRRPRPEDYLAAVPAPDRDGLLRELLALESAHRRRLGEDPRPDGPDDEAEAPERRPEQGGRFQLLGRVGAGAFATVWKARDAELGRVVALKVPHAGALAGPEDRERFRREARAAAQLRHPGIVTVHEVVTLDGAPALVCDFVAGAALKDLLAVRRLTPREGAALVAELAEAVHYAHGMGVVHRDLKPANVLIECDGPSAGAVGRPLVTDFGLALRDGAEATLTRDGQLIGTPAYMSPEQAAGRGHAADGRSDVYSLGVILYELLTGERPFRGDAAAVRLQVLNGEPRPPRRLSPKLPRDLETVCLKAMARTPEGRYGTARELADDLRRFLAGEPVRARSAGPAERVARWARRNPLAAGLLAALVLAGGLAVTTYLWQDARREKEEAERQQRRADELFEQAEAAIYEGFTKLSVTRQLQGPGREQVRKELLETALAFWQRHEDEPAVRRQVALAYRDASQSRRRACDPAGAVQAARKAVALYEQLCRDNPGSVDYLHRLAWACADLGLAQGDLDQFDDQLRSYRKALEVRQRMAALAPDDHRTRQGFPWAYANLGECLANKGEFEEARRHFEAADAGWRQVCQADPTNAWQQSAWAETSRELGEVYGKLGRPQDALRLYRQAHELFAGLSAQKPDDLGAQWNLAVSAARLGRGYAGAGQAEAALRWYEDARRRQEKVLHANPAGRTAYHDTLLETHVELAEVQRNAGRVAEAAETARAWARLWPDDGSEQYNAACLLALCVPAVGKGGPGLTPEGRDERRRYADEALAALRRALDKGFADVGRLKEDPDLEPLRAREDFKDLLRSVEARAAPR